MKRFILWAWDPDKHLMRVSLLIKELLCGTELEESSMIGINCQPKTGSVIVCTKAAMFVWEVWINPLTHNRQPFCVGWWYNDSPLSLFQMTLRAKWSGWTTIRRSSDCRKFWCGFLYGRERREHMSLRSVSKAFIELNSMSASASLDLYS